MGVRDTRPVELPTTDTSLTRAFYLFVFLPILLSAGHHVDHVVRGSHVGWAVTPG